METESTLENLVVLDNIFKNLSFTDLLTCRRVCRLWNTETTKVIGRRQSCIIRVRGQYPCSALSRLEELLTSSCVTFASVFIGISIDIDSSLRDNCINHDHHLYINLLNILPPDLKYLRLNWSQTDNCAVQDLSHKLLRKYENSLEELVLNDLRELYRILENNYVFPNLRILILEHYIHIGNIRRLDPQPEPDPRDIRTLLYRFLERTEKIERIYGIQFCSLLQVPPEKHHAIWALEYDAIDLGRPYSEELYAKYAAKKRQLRYLSIQRPPEITNCSTVCKLMEGSKPTLKSIRFWCPFVEVMVQCLRSGLEPLPFVEKIDINLSLAESTAEIRRKIGQLIFYLFPNLKIVSLQNCEYGEEDYDDLFQQFQNIPVDHVSGSKVSVLFYGNGYLPRQPPLSLEFVRDLFPNLTQLDYEARGYTDLQSVVHMWTAWPDLVEIHVKGEVSNTSDFDAEFCGISSQEAEFLRSQSTKFLEKVHIVPIRPAMYFLKDLRKLSMMDSYNPGCRTRSLDLLTELTGHVVFKRMPDLHVQVTAAESDQGLKRLSDAGFIELESSYDHHRTSGEMWLIV